MTYYYTREGHIHLGSTRTYPFTSRALVIDMRNMESTYGRASVLRFILGMDRRTQ